MQLQLTFDKPKKVAKLKVIKQPELSKAEKFKLSVENYFKLNVHQRINIRSWLCYCSLRIFHEQQICVPNENEKFNKFYQEHYEGYHSINEDNLQYGINQY